MLTVLAEWLHRRPWSTLLIVLLGVALPLLVLGEVSANETRERARHKEIESAAAAAQRAADVVAARANVLQSQLLRIGEDVDLQLALGERDESRLNGILLAFERVLRADFALGTLALVAADGRMLAAPRPPITNIQVGDDLSAQAYFQEATRTRRPRAELSRDEPARVVIFAAPVARLDKLLGVLVAELRLRALAEWVRPQVGPGEDVYVIDRRGLLLARATAPGEAVVDLSAAPAVGRALLEQRFVERVTDPIRGEPHLLASVRVPDLDWTVMVVRPADAFERELGAALDELRALRLLLVVLLLLGAYGFARVGGRLRQRTALAQLSASSVAAS